MTVASEKKKVWNVKKAVESKFDAGYDVPVLVSNKLNKRFVNWQGLGKIDSQILGMNNISIITVRREKSQTYHMRMLKPYKIRT